MASRPDGRLTLDLIEAQYLGERHDGRTATSGNRSFGTNLNQFGADESEGRERVPGPADHQCEGESGARNAFRSRDDERPFRFSGREARTAGRFAPNWQPMDGPHERV